MSYDPQCDQCVASKFACDRHMTSFETNDAADQPRMTPDHEAAEIAKGLTDPQRAALALFSDQWCSESYADGRTLQALDRRKLTGRYARSSDFRDVRVTVTPLGRRVRAHLQGETA